MENTGRLVPPVDLTTVLRDEIVFETAIRLRLQQTVQARIKWATTLQELLLKEERLSSNDDSSSSDLQAFALDAYDTIEDARYSFLPHGIIQSSVIESSPAYNAVPPPPTASTSRNGLRPQPGARPRPEKREYNTYLYIRDTSSTPTMVYKICCPDCSRSNFPRLQGLLNHCRLKHGVEFGNHDECIQHCAVVVSEDEQPEVIANGTEIHGMSASLRRLFEMAVGTSMGIMGGASSSSASISQEIGDAEMQSLESTLLTKTLGHHVDTPALAPFLGRAPKRRQINVVNEDDIVDILAEEEAGQPPWRMSYQKRSRVHFVDDDEDTVHYDDGETPALNKLNKLTERLTESSSRFHVTARIAVADWSLHLSDVLIKKNGGAVTHKWMLAVRSPVYSFHVSTVVVRMIVRSLTVPPPPSLAEPMIVTEPPFSAMGLTDKPFLARVTLEWAGTQNNPTHIEHFVELDSLRSSKPVLGEEQYIDVELDRNTEFVPRRDDLWEVDWFTDSIDKKRIEDVPSPRSVEAVPEQIQRLKALLPRFPMTRKDTSLRTAPRVPYLLPRTVAHFFDLVPGRRKAIQWGRANALWEAYSSAPPTDTNVDAPSPISSAIDVYRWLERERQFPQPPTPIVVAPAPMLQPGTIDKQASDEDTYCAVCGIAVSAHPSWPSHDEKGPHIPALCSLPEYARRMPLFDVKELRSRHVPLFQQGPSSENTRQRSPRISVSDRELVSMVDPVLTSAVNRVASSLKLPTVPLVDTGPQSLHGIQGAGIYERLAPSAFLALSSRVFIRRLVDAGIRAMATSTPITTAAENSSAPASAMVGSSARRDKQHRRDKNTEWQKRRQLRLLTPAHLLRGISEPTLQSTLPRRLSDDALLVALGRAGIVVQPEGQEEAPASAVHAMETVDT